MLGILGKKIGMSRIVLENGVFIPVTYVLAEGNEIIQIRTIEKDGYSALVLGFDAYAQPRKNKKYKFVKEVAVENTADYKVGDKISIADLGDLESVKITGISKGKGFQGGVRRWNFKVARKTHGTKDARHGSTMSSAITARAKPGIKMPGRMGLDQVTLRDRKVVAIDKEKNIYGVKGAIPGTLGSYVVLQK